MISEVVRRAIPQNLRELRLGASGIGVSLARCRMALAELTAAICRQETNLFEAERNWGDPAGNYPPLLEWGGFRPRPSPAVGAGAEVAQCNADCLAPVKESRVLRQSRQD